MTPLNLETKSSRWLVLGGILFFFSIGLMINACTSKLNVEKNTVNPPVQILKNKLTTDVKVIHADALLKRAVNVLNMNPEGGIYRNQLKAVYQAVAVPFMRTSIFSAQYQMAYLKMSNALCKLADLDVAIPDVLHVHDFWFNIHGYELSLDAEKDLAEIRALNQNIGEKKFLVCLYILSHPTAYMFGMMPSSSEDKP